MHNEAEGPSSVHDVALCLSEGVVQGKELESYQLRGPRGMQKVWKFIQDLGCPTRLRDAGVKESDLIPLAEAVMEEVPLMENPRPIRGVDEVLGILRRAW